MRSPFADAGKFEFSSKPFKHYYDGGAHTGLMRGMTSPGFTHFNQTPQTPSATSSGMMMNSLIPNKNDEHNDYRLTGRDFVSLDWGFGGETDDDYDSESDESYDSDRSIQEQDQKKISEKEKREKEFDKFDYLEESDSSEDDLDDDELSSYDDEDYGEEDKLAE